MRASFPAQSRLRESREFKRVFANGRKFAASGILLIAAAGEKTYPRLGLALAKRRVNRAVDRNRVKRVVRESFRLSSQHLGRIDVVVLARSRTAEYGNFELFSQLETLWPQAATMDLQSPPKSEG